MSVDLRTDSDSKRGRLEGALGPNVLVWVDG